MKKAMLMAAALLVAVTSFAQVQIGAGYVNSSDRTKISNDAEVSTAASNGVYAGLGVTLPLAGDLAVTPGVYYMFLTSHNGRSVANGILSASGDLQEHYVNVPIYFNYGAELVPNFRLFFFGGPTFSAGIISKTVLSASILGFSANTAMIIMMVLALVGVAGSFVIGVLDDKLGTKKTMIYFGIWYALALVLNFTNIMPLVYGSLFMIAIGIGGSANFTTSLPTSVFGRQGFSKVNSVVFPIQGAVTALQFLINAIVQKVTGGQIRYAYLIFVVVAVINIILVTRVNEHKYNRDYLKQNGMEKELQEVEAFLAKTDSK